MSPTLTFKAGGTLGQNDFYIEREADAQLLAHCLNGDFAYVLTTRQVGKSSLMERTAYRLAEEHHVRTAIIDLNKIGTTGITSASWYYSIMQVIEEALNLTTKVEDWWPENPHLTDVARFQRFLEQVVLAEVADPVVIFIDEIEGTLKLDFADDFFAAVRSLYNARAHTPALERLTFVLIGSATPNEFIQDPERTPFNIGHGVELDDFRDVDEAAAFTAGFDAPEEKARQILGWVLAWTRGHPYLTQKVCAELVKGEKLPTSKREVKAVIQKLFLAPESDDSNIQFVGRELPKPSNPQDRDAVLSTYLEIWAGVPVPDDAKSPIHAHLKLAGPVRREKRFLRVRNPIYRRVFDWRWMVQRLSWLELWSKFPATLKTMTKIIGVSWLALLILVIFAFNRSYLIARQERIARAGFLASQAQDIPETSPNVGLILAVSALKELGSNDPKVPLAETVLREKLQTRWTISLQGHEREVLTLAISPDGKWMASGSEDKTVRLWSMENPNEDPIVLLGNQDIVEEVVFSPDGRWLASAGADGTVRAWNIQNLEDSPILFPVHSGIVYTVLFSPDSRWLASGGDDSIIQLWDIQNPLNEPIKLRGLNGIVFNLAFSPNGDWLSGGGSEDSFTLLWKMGDILENASSLPIVLEGVGVNFVQRLVFDSDGTWLANTSGNYIQLWNMKDISSENLSPIIFGIGEDGISSLQFSSNGQWLAAGGYSGMIQIWDLKAPKSESVMLDGHKGFVFALAFSPDGQILASGGNDRIVRLWDLENLSKEPENLYNFEANILDLVFSQDGHWLAGAGLDKLIRLWDMDIPSTDPIILPGHDESITALNFSPNGQWLASGSKDHAIQIWDWQDPYSKPMILLGHTDEILSIAFSPDNHWLASSSRANTVLIWNLQKPDIPPIILHEKGAQILYNLTFSPDGQWLVGIEPYGKIVLWDIKNLSPEYRILFNLQRGPDIAFSSNGRWIIATDHLSVAYIDLEDENFTPKKLLLFNALSLWNFDISSNGQYVLGSIPDDGRTLMKIWEIQESPENGLVLKERNDILLNTPTTFFSSNGNWLMNVEYGEPLNNYLVRLWNLNNPGEQPIVLPYASIKNFKPLISSDGFWLAENGLGNKIELWNLRSLSSTPVILKSYDEPYSGLIFSPDGDWLVSGSVYGEIWLWNMDVGNLLEKACQMVGRNLTKYEWAQYFPGQPYRKTCDQWPEGE